ncbi:MAG: sulfur carrier protein ThiS [Polyangiaceae bacterium]
MQLTVNGETRDVGDAKSIRELVRALGIGDGPVAIEVNRSIVPRAEHASFVLHEGDIVDIVRFVGGG